MEWISVEERLPETNDAVIVAISVDKIHLIGYELSCCWNGNWTTENAREFATHWCPIPQGPLPWKELNMTSFPKQASVRVKPNFFKE